MSDYLSRLAIRATAQRSAIEPVLRPLFAPPDAEPLERSTEVVAAPRVLPQPAAAQAPRPLEPRADRSVPVVSPPLHAPDPDARARQPEAIEVAISRAPAPSHESAAMARPPAALPVPEIAEAENAHPSPAVATRPAAAQVSTIEREPADSSRTVEPLSPAVLRRRPPPAPPPAVERESPPPRANPVRHSADVPAPAAGPPAAARREAVATPSPAKPPMRVETVRIERVRSVEPAPPPALSVPEILPPPAAESGRAPAERARGSADRSPTPAGGEAAEIHVRIGRIEVRALAQQPPAPTPRRGPALSLEDFLEKPSGGRR